MRTPRFTIPGEGAIPPGRERGGCGRLREPAWGEGSPAAAGLGGSGTTRGREPHTLVVLLSRVRPVASRTKWKGDPTVAFSAPRCWLADAKEDPPPGYKDRRGVVSGEPSFLPFPARKNKPNLLGWWGWERKTTHNQNQIAKTTSPNLPNNEKSLEAEGTGEGKAAVQGRCPGCSLPGRPWHVSAAPGAGKAALSRYRQRGGSPRPASALAGSAR